MKNIKKIALMSIIWSFSLISNYDYKSYGDIKSHEIAKSWILPDYVAKQHEQLMEQIKLDTLKAKQDSAWNEYVKNLTIADQDLVKSSPMISWNYSLNQNDYNEYDDNGIRRARITRDFKEQYPDFKSGFDAFHVNNEKNPQYKDFPYGEFRSSLAKSITPVVKHGYVNPSTALFMLYNNPNSSNLWNALTDPMIAGTLATGTLALIYYQYKKYFQDQKAIQENEEKAAQEQTENDKSQASAEDQNA